MIPEQEKNIFDCNIINNYYINTKWNTRWAFQQKHDIFRYEKITIAMV